MSVPDQYMVRAGADFKLNSFTFSGGLRMECVPFMIWLAEVTVSEDQVMYCRQSR